MHNNLNEFPLILGCLWEGFVLGIFYDLLRLVRIRGGIMTAVCDLLFAAVNVCRFTQQTLEGVRVTVTRGGHPSCLVLRAIQGK